MALLKKLVKRFVEVIELCVNLFVDGEYVIIANREFCVDGVAPCIELF
jgi:hypothetical protein